MEAPLQNNSPTPPNPDVRLSTRVLVSSCVCECMNKSSCVIEQGEDKGKLNPPRRQLETRAALLHASARLTFHPGDPRRARDSLSRRLIGEVGEGNLKVTRG